jgi:beta-lactamase regulating signal transducer with metallopeptidase domain
MMTLVAGAAVRLTWTGLGAWRLRQFRACSPATSRRFAETAKALDVRARLVVSEGAHSPFTFDTRAAVVVIPAWVLSAADDVQRAIFLHELLHVARGDWRELLLEELVRVVLWFHPAAWWLTRELAQAREEVVDHRAAICLGSRRKYLAALLAADTRIRSAWTTAPMFVRQRQLARRVRALATEGP